MIISFAGKLPQVAKSTIISQSAQIIGDVKVGENCIIFPGAVVRGDFACIRIGQGVWIEDNCILHAGPEDLIIGDNVIIGHGAAINCQHIGNNVLVGMNATLLHKASIGNNCIIGAATLVGEGMNVPDSSFVAGVPGKIKSKPTEKQLWWVTRDRKDFSEFLDHYRASQF